MPTRFVSLLVLSFASACSGRVLKADGGFIDAGPVDAGPPSISLAVAPNPNSVLSAVASVDWGGPVSGVSIRYWTDGGPCGQTPVWSVSGVTSPFMFPVLGLSESTPYSFVAVGTYGDGGMVTSDTATLTTYPLPPGFPAFSVIIPDGGIAPEGYTLVDALPVETANPFYAVIVDSTGKPVWYMTTDYLFGIPELEGDFQQQPDGTYTLAILDAVQVTGIQDEVTRYYQIDGLGNILKIWTALDDPNATPPVSVVATDDHEFRLQPNGDALLFGFVEADDVDLTDAGGKPDAGIIGDVLERVTQSGEVTFSWNSLTNMKVTDMDPACSFTLHSQFVDFPHANAIDVTDDGNYLVSARNASQVLKINAADGGTMWTLGGSGTYSPGGGGPKGDFTFVNDPLGGFSCQHGVRELPDGHIILFDDGDGHEQPIPITRAVEYELDTTAMTATLVWSAAPPSLAYSFILGFAQRLDNGDTLIADGTGNSYLDDGGTPLKTVQEVDSNGNLVWELVVNQDVFGVYRAFRLNSLYGP